MMYVYRKMENVEEEREGGGESEIAEYKVGKMLRFSMRETL